MKKIKTVLLFTFVLILGFSFTSCKGGNPFNFIIGKMTKSVEKKQPKVPKVTGKQEEKVTEEITKKITGKKKPVTERDSLKILESALGIERFHYSSEGRRDPFETLFKGKELNVENVQLIGTIWGPKGRFALLKESGGTGYVVSIGDKIADGRVIDITSSSVTFEIRKFGVSSKVTLVLEEKEEKLKK